MKLKFLVFILSVVFSFISKLDASMAQTQVDATKLTLKEAEVFKFTDVVWGFDFLDDANVLVTLRGGDVQLLNLNSKSARPIKGGPDVVVYGQGGLLDVRVQKSKTKTFVYFTGSARPTKGSVKERENFQTTALFRGEWVGSAEAGSLQSLTRIFEAQPALDSGLHFGSRIAIHKDGSLYISIGERNDRVRAQDLRQHWGKVLRLKLDGQSYSSTPLISGALAEIYSYGHRNPQGIGIHPATGHLFVVEHGPRGGDEINLVKPGANYGWPIVSYGREYSGPIISESPKAPGVEDPLKYYVPSIAPSSLHFSTGKKIPFLKDRMIIGALAMQHLNVVDLKQIGGRFKAISENRFFEKLGERIRSVNESPSGDLYIGTDSGRFLRIEPIAKP